MAFANCKSLADITIPASVTSIGSRAFTGTAWENSQPNGLVYAGKVLYSYFGTMPENTVINNIREDTKAIAEFAFAGCIGLTSITIPASVTSIGHSAFYMCSSLTSIAIPANVTSIGQAAFAYCSSLKNITIPASVTSIGSRAFSECPLSPAVRADIIKRFGKVPFGE